jgi:cytochrome b561
MHLKDTPASYGAVSRINHWLGAAVVLALLAVGLYFEDMPRGDEKLYWVRLHISVGMVAFVFIAFRVLWRVAVRSPDPLPQAPALQNLTRAVHWVLLLAMVVLFVTGPIMVWSGGRAISVFNWFDLASPLGKMEALHEGLEGVHAVAGKVLLVVVALHVAAVLKHTLIDRGGSLARMLGGARA